MKKLFILLIFFIASCSSEDNSTESMELSGTYYLQSINFAGLPLPIGECESASTISFTESNFELNFFSEQDDNCYSDTVSDDYSREGNKIIIDEPGISGQVISSEVVRLSYSQFKLTFEKD